MSLPRDVEEHARRADRHLARNELPAAAAELEAVLRGRPHWGAALLNYASVLLRLQRDAEAEGALQRLLDLEPRLVIAYRLLASLLHRQGRVAEVLRLCAAGRARNPDSLELESFELFLLNFDEATSAEALFERHRAWGARLEARVSPMPAAAKTDRQRLKIGYVSGDFNYHPVGLFMLPALERHDRAGFEVYAYSTNTQPDAHSARLAAAAHHWRDAAALSDEQLAHAVRDDGIDVLVDLAGHSGASRLGVFARQAAPVQAAWLGYLNTTGLTRIGYRISDRHADPLGQAERLHTETLVRLPGSQWCYRPFLEVDCAPEPAIARNGHLTFGSFAQAAKLSPGTRRLWARILAAIPRARLQLVGMAAGRAREDLLRDFAAEGISTERLRLAPFLPVEDYYRSFAEVDIALDPMPYSGGTTTCDALWMGVPVLTLAGSRPASRSAASILATLGMDGWTAASADEYFGMACGWAGRAADLASLRKNLRARMRASPLMDEAGFTRELEKAYRAMWQGR
jgi:predicted O-linked N-acetylglucosamine transferase (SPINDLY family)